MTNQEILTKAIEKSMQNGYRYNRCEVRSKGGEGIFFGPATYQECIDCLKEYMKYPTCKFNYVVPVVDYWVDKHVIFTHDFAKAFWGGQKHKSKVGDREGFYDPHQHCQYCEVRFLAGYDNDWPDTLVDTCWQYHLQQMVLEEDAIKYLEKFL